MRIHIVLFLLAFPFMANAEKALLRVEAKHLEWTGLAPESSCEEKKKADEVCITWSYWNTYSAKVKKVVMGKFVEREFKFALLQHASYVDSYLKDFYILIDEFSNKKTVSRLGTRYYAKEVGFPERIVCMKADLNEEFPNEKEIDIDRTSCYSEDDLLELDDDT